MFRAGADLREIERRVGAGRFMRSIIWTNSELFGNRERVTRRAPIAFQNSLAPVHIEGAGRRAPFTP
jgi:hypothetical protein